jgi:ABC-2 type transport system permease protein
MASELFTNFPITKLFMGRFADQLVSVSLIDAFLTLEFFSWFAVLLGFYPIIDAAIAIAGEVEQRTLDILLAQPISRSRVLLEKFLAIAIHLAVICLTSFLILWAALAIWVSETYSLRAYAFIFINLFLLLVTFEAFGFLCSVLLPSLKMVFAVGYGCILLGFVLYKGLSAFNKAQWLTSLIPFYYADPTKILVYGRLDGTDSLVLIGTSAGLLVLSLILFERKDIAVA